MAITKEPSQVAAAVEIVGAARRAIAEAMEKFDGRPWDSDVLLYELARVLALVLRNEEMTPSQVDSVIRFLREVYAGVYPTHLVSVEEAVQMFCASQEDDPGRMAGDDSVGPTTLH